MFPNDQVHCDQADIIASAKVTEELMAADKYLKNCKNQNYTTLECDGSE